MNEFNATLLLAVLGFFVGGLLGIAFDGGFFPDAWYGALVFLGVPLVGIFGLHD